MSSPIVLQWRKGVGDNWETLEFSGVPVSFPAKTRIDFSMSGLLPGVEGLIDKIKDLIFRVHGTINSQASPESLVAPDAGDNLLEVLVSDGQTTFPLEDRISKALQQKAQTWVLPLMPKGGAPGIMPAELRTQNIAFWTNSIDELALTIIARAGVTSLARRVFISYRRADTEPIAGQLFEALTDRNFQVFLDTVSVDPGINFQASLFEQLADKSMVVLLHSETFSQSAWTMAELTYAREHDLSLLILRMPTVKANDPLDAHYRAGDVICLRNSDLSPASSGTPQQLTASALGEVLQQIMEVHDVEMINRLALLRQDTLDALEANQVTHSESMQSASIFAQSGNGGKTYRLFPTSRPPGLPELFDASTFTREQGERRIVVGRISSFNVERRKHLDWTVRDRNVLYVDVTMLDSLAQQIKAGSL